MDNLLPCINNNSVIQVSQVKVLGIYVDENLLLKYINYIKFFLSKNINAMIKIYLCLLDSKSVKKL